MAFVQHGYVGAYQQTDVSIAPIDTTKSFLKIIHQKWFTGGGGSSELRAEILNSTTVRFYTSTGQFGGGQINFEVVTLD
jgi:hypothetical protein